MVVLTIVGAAALAQHVDGTEQQLREARGRDAANLIEGLGRQFHAGLRTGSVAARAARGDPQRFVDNMRGLIPSTIASNVFLIRRVGARGMVVARTGTANPELLGARQHPNWPGIWGASRSSRPRHIDIRGVGDGRVISYALSGGAPNEAVYAEVNIAQTARRAFRSETQLDGAVYVGPVESSLTFLGATTTRLPIGGRRVTQPVNFGDGHGAV